MEIIKILKIEVLDNKLIHFYFNDNSEKIIDLKNFIKKGTINEILNNEDYFRKVKIYDNGRGIYWPDGYDLCPDTLRYFTEPVKEPA